MQNIEKRLLLGPGLGDRKHRSNTNTWKRGYDDNLEMCLLGKMIDMMSKVIKKNLLKVDSNYRGILRRPHMVNENDMIVFRELLGSGSDS